MTKSQFTGEQTTLAASQIEASVSVKEVFRKRLLFGLSIEGRFVFHPKQLDDFVDDDVRCLFGRDGDLSFAALCAGRGASP